jgi:hypothetical protein
MTTKQRGTPTAERWPDGLTVAPVWIYFGSCPVWRGYDPDRQPVHAAGEEAFVTEHDAHWGESAGFGGIGADRCSCGGLYCGCGKHYPPEFLTELDHAAMPTATS